MSGEVKVAESATGILDKILSYLFTGTSTDAVIAILLLVVGVLGFAVYVLAKRLGDKDKLLTETVENSNAEITNLAGKYMESINSIHEQQAEQARLLNDSMTSTRLLLTEMKGLITVISNNNVRHL